MYDKLTVMDMATSQMNWLAQRTEVVSENIANADTPGYTPKDVQPLDFKGMITSSTGVNGPDVPQVTMVATNPRDIVPPQGSPVVTQSRVYQASPDGNAVGADEQSKKLGDIKISYQAAASLYAKQVSLLKLAIMGHE